MKKKMLILCLVILLCGLSSGITYYLIKRNGEEKTNNTTPGEVNKNTTIKVLSNTEASEKVENVMNDFYQNIFYLHNGVICGETDSSDTLPADVGDYYASRDYKNIEELKTYLSSIVSKNYINYLTSSALVSDMGIEGIEPYRSENGKLYCYMVPMGSRGLISADYKVVKVEPEKITAEADVISQMVGPDESIIHSEFTLILENNKWVLDSLKITSDEALDSSSSFVYTIMDEYYENILQGIYCGEKDSSDILPAEVGDYYASLTYKNVDEIKNHFRNFASEKYVDYLTSSKIVSDMGLEGIEPYRNENGKLYCYAPPMGGQAFESAYYYVKVSDNKTITGSASLNTKFAMDTYTKEALFTLVRENNKWVLDEYQEN